MRPARRRVSNADLAAALAPPQDAGRVALREISRLYRHRKLLVAVVAALLLILISALRLQKDYP